MQLGNKHICFSCNSKFYDLGRAEIVCPKCGANQIDAPEKVDMAAIAAKVMASAVQESDASPENSPPLADDMDIFGGDMSPDGSGDANSSPSATVSDTDGDDFADDDDDF
jgi:uncharacterized protein (TIGR02300 family)